MRDNNQLRNSSDNVPKFRGSSVLVQASLFKGNPYYRKAGRFRNSNQYDSFVKYEPDRIQSRDEKVTKYLKLMETEDEAVIMATDSRQLIKNIISRQAIADSGTSEKASRETKGGAHARYGSQGRAEFLRPQQVASGLPPIFENPTARSHHNSLQQHNGRTHRHEAALTK